MGFDQQSFSTALDKNLIQIKHVVSLIVLNLTPFKEPDPVVSAYSIVQRLMCTFEQWKQNYYDCINSYWHSLK